MKAGVGKRFWSKVFFIPVQFSRLNVSVQILLCYDFALQNVSICPQPTLTSWHKMQQKAGGGGGARLYFPFFLWHNYLFFLHLRDLEDTWSRLLKIKNEIVQSLFDILESVMRMRIVCNSFISSYTNKLLGCWTFSFYFLLSIIYSVTSSLHLK